MAQLTFSGKITKVCPTKTFNSGSACRQFWAEENTGNGYGKNKYPNILAFEVFTSYKGPNERFACVSDLDNIKPNQPVRFTYEPQGNIWKSPKTGEEKCFFKLQVVSKIEVFSANPRSHQAGSSVPAPATPEADMETDMDDDSSMPF